jgi:hypothetical protein
VTVVATGLADTIRLSGDANDVAPSSRIGMGTTLPAGAGGPPPGELVMAVSRGGYCGIVRLEDGRIDIAAALDRGLIAQTGSPARAVASILAETMFLAESGGGISPGDPPGRIMLDSKLLGAATWRGTPPLTRSQPVADATGRILRIGDAAGYVEPFTGEGMGWALASALESALEACITTDRAVLRLRVALPPFLGARCAHGMYASQLHLEEGVPDYPGPWQGHSAGPGHVLMHGTVGGVLACLQRVLADKAGPPSLSPLHQPAAFHRRRDSTRRMGTGVGGIMAETRAAVPVARARGACTGADPREAAAMTERRVEAH